VDIFRYSLDVILSIDGLSLPLLTCTGIQVYFMLL